MKVDTIEEVHVRRVVEQQPVCLVRIGRDGTFLAANDAALSLFGATELEQLLDTSLFARVDEGQAEACRAFVERVASGDRASLELRIRTLADSPHDVQFHGAPIPGSEDGLASAFCVIHDISKRRRLESSLLVAAAREEEAQARLREVGEQAARDRASVAALEASVTAATVREQALAGRIAEMQERLDEAMADVDAARRELEMLRQRDRLERSALQARADGAIADAEAARRELDLIKSEGGAQRSELEARLQAALAESEAARRELDALKSEGSAERSQLQARLEHAFADAEAVRRELEVLKAEAEAERAALYAELDVALRTVRIGHGAVAMAKELEQVLTKAADHGRAMLSTLAGDGEALAQVEQHLLNVLEARPLARRLSGVAPVPSATNAAAVLQALGPGLERILDPAITFRPLIVPSDTVVDIASERLEAIVTVFTAAQRVRMRDGGALTLELADVQLDESCALQRNAAPGPYVLVAFHAAGVGVDAGLPAAFFDAPADADLWNACGPGMGAAVSLLHSAGGHAWATKEDAAAVAFELYLPAQHRASSGGLE